MNCGDCKYSHDTGTALLCWGQRFAPPVDADHWCEGWKPKSVTPLTNADHIRGMSDEELADWMAINTDCFFCKIKSKNICSLDEGTCTEEWLSWLKSPVEEGEG